jgi:GT2 family glycosyltransferase
MSKPILSICTAVRHDNGVRDRLLNWTVPGWKSIRDDIEVIVGEDDYKGGFCLPMAHNDAARKASSELLLFMDNDVVPNREIIEWLLETDRNGRKWGWPYHNYCPLTPEATERFLSGTTGADFTINKADYGGYHMLDFGGACWMVEKQLYWKVGGQDEKFRGWGWEDTCLFHMLKTFGGPPFIAPSISLFHLCHPHLPNPEVNPNEALAMRYVAMLYKKDRKGLMALARERPTVNDYACS